ncbi:YcfL family protein [Symbiopectobacterium sp.]|uniref:YcfL family protein n=1 Tax=Symbiopectobacterium sp. TaxID=2952789 RepID=UPI003F3044A0
MNFQIVRGLLSAVFVLGAVACSSTPPVLTINERQTLVLDASLLSAGITASKPDLTTRSEGGSACAVLRNTSSQAVAVQYRFYWYDGKGLDVLPYDEVRSVLVQAQSEVRIAGAHEGQNVQQVRLHLFL